jgi:hypothetical protein
LENRLAAHHSALRTRALWTRTGTLAVHHRPMLYGRWRRRRINRARASLRRDHAALRNQRLLRNRLGRRSCRSGWLSTRRSSGRLRCRCCRRRRSLGQRLHCWRLLWLSWRWSYHHGRRRGRFLCCGGWRRRRNNRRRLARRRNHNRSLRHGWLYNRFFRDRRLCRNRSWRRLLRFRRSCCRRRFGRRRCGSGRRDRMLHLLLPFFQQPQHVSRLLRLGEVDLRLDIRRSGLVPGSRAGFGREILPDLHRFIFFNGA